jgi:predicted DNA-binding protein
MSTISLRLPESVHRRLAELAEQEGVSLNQLIASAAAEKLAAIMTEQYLADRAANASRSRFAQVLAKVPDVAPEPFDAPPPRPPAKPRAKEAKPRKAANASRRRG